MRKQKWLALGLACIMVLGLTGCIGNLYSKVLTVDGRDISPGLYQMLQYNAMNEAKTKAAEEDEEFDSAEDDVLKQKIEGESASNWIQNRTEELSRRYVAVSKLCVEKDIQLSSENQSQIDEMDQYWSMIGTMYEDNGITQDVWHRVMENDLLRDQLFLNLYGEDGDKAVPDKEMKNQYAEQYANVQYLMVSLPEAGGDKEAIQKEADRLVKLVQGGKTLEDLAKEDLEKLYSLVGAEYDASAAAEGITSSYLAYDQSDDTEGVYTEEFLTKLKDQKVGAAGSTEAGSSLLIYKKIALFEDDDAFAAKRNDVVKALYTDEYNEYLKSIYDEYEVDKAFGAQWYYRPSKLDFS